MRHRAGAPELRHPHRRKIHLALIHHPGIDPTHRVGTLFFDSPALADRFRIERLVRLSEAARFRSPAVRTT